MTDPGKPAQTPVVPHMAAAVVALRQGPAGMEVLVGRRTAAARFMGGFWVFPGGRVEPVDGSGDAGFRRAAARELAEEAGLTVDAEALVPFDRWITPEPFPRRFDTVFYVAATGPDATVEIDGEEIVDSRWATPADLLRDAEAGRILLSYPTLRQLEKLTAWTTVADTLSACSAAAPPDGVPAVLAPTPPPGD